MKTRFFASMPAALLLASTPLFAQATQPGSSPAAGARPTPPLTIQPGSQLGPVHLRWTRQELDGQQLGTLVDDGAAHTVQATAGERGGPYTFHLGSDGKVVEIEAPLAPQQELELGDKVSRYGGAEALAAALHCAPAEAKGGGKEWSCDGARIISAGGADSIHVFAGRPHSVKRADGELSFAREGTAWVPTDMLCVSPDDASLAYFVSKDGAASLHVQAARDGKQSGAVQLSSQADTDGDCAAGSCFTEFTRGVSGGEGQLEYRGQLSNTSGDWEDTFEVTPSSAKLPKLQCPGGQLFALCVSQRWEIRVEQEPSGDGSQSGQLSYQAKHLDGKKESLELKGGKVVKSGKGYRLDFDNKGFRYELEASADKSAPGATLHVTQGKKTILREACTAYTISPLKLAALKSGH